MAVESCSDAGLHISILGIVFLYFPYSLLYPLATGSVGAEKRELLKGPLVLRHMPSRCVSLRVLRPLTAALGGDELIGMR